MAPSGHSELFNTKLNIHDRKQFELKLEYQPSGTDSQSEYFVEMLLFVPRSLNIGLETWPRESIYSDLHNYVRFKTPVLSYDEILSGEHSPLIQIEQRLQLGLLGTEAELVYDAKMLSCVVRGVLRRFYRSVKDTTNALARRSEKNASDERTQTFAAETRSYARATQEILERYRVVVGQLCRKYSLGDKTRASLRLVDEYQSLLLEHYFRRSVVQMDQMPREGVWTELRRELLSAIVEDESYRRQSGLMSVLVPESDNEEYSHRVGLLKKFCMNILFLKVQRGSMRKAWEEVLFAIAAGGAMAFALGVGLFAQSRYPQASFNFFIMAVVGYMLKDRIKESLRKFFAEYAGKFLYERSTHIIDQVTGQHIGVCKEKIDYGVAVDVPPEVAKLRQHDDLVTVAHGEVAESIIRYRKKIVLASERLPRIADGMITGVTDIIRLNVHRLLHDMDDPEYSVEYVDLEDFSIERLRLSKAYRVDFAFKFSVDDGRHQRTTLRMIRLVLDRNGIKRMTELAPEIEISMKATSRQSVAVAPERPSIQSS